MGLRNFPAPVCNKFLPECVLLACMLILDWCCFFLVCTKQCVKCGIPQLKCLYVPPRNNTRHVLPANKQTSCVAQPLRIKLISFFFFSASSEARPCPLLAKAPKHGRMNCSHPHSLFSFGSRCEFKCSEGFSLRGPPATACNSSSRWNDDAPTCQRERKHNNSDDKTTLLSLSLFWF